MNNTPVATSLRFAAALVVIVWSTASLASDKDEMKQRLLACAGCHEQGAYAPTIDGKPVEYLYQQLLNYREGRRLNNTMTKMLAYLSTDYLHEIASYYAALPVKAYVRPSNANVQSSAESDIGKRLVQEGMAGPACVACHGHDLQGDGVAIPGLRGLSAKYIAAQLGAWQADTRQARAPDCMKKVADHLSGDEIYAVSHWIANSFEQAASQPLADAEIPLPCGALQ